MLKSLVKEILSQSATQSTSTAPSTELLQQTWATLVGNELARCTIPVAWNNGVLELEVSSARWLDEFSRQRSRLRNKIAGLLPWPLNDIRLKIASPANVLRFAELANESTAQPKPPQPSRKTAADSDKIANELALPPNIIAELEPLDDDLRYNLLRIRQHIVKRQNNASES